MAINLEEILGDFKSEAGKFSGRMKSAGVPENITARTAVNRNSALAGSHRTISSALGRVMGNNAMALKASPYAAGALMGGAAFGANKLSNNFANNHPMSKAPLTGIKAVGLGAAILDPALMPGLLKSAMRVGAKTVSQVAEKTDVAGARDVGAKLLNKAKAPKVKLPNIDIPIPKSESENVLDEAMRHKHQTVVKEIAAGFDAREAAATASAKMEQASGVEARRAGYENLKNNRDSKSTPTGMVLHNPGPIPKEQPGVVNVGPIFLNKAAVPEVNMPIYDGPTGLVHYSRSNLSSERMKSDAAQTNNRQVHYERLKNSASRKKALITRPEINHTQNIEDAQKQVQAAQQALEELRIQQKPPEAVPFVPREYKPRPNFTEEENFRFRASHERREKEREERHNTAPLPSEVQDIMDGQKKAKLDQSQGAVKDALSKLRAAKNNKRANEVNFNQHSNSLEVMRAGYRNAFDEEDRSEAGGSINEQTQSMHNYAKQVGVRILPMV